MLEYRIPLAAFASTAIFAVCFVIALLMVINATSGRSRVLAVLGLFAVFGSTALQAANKSVAGAYGTETVGYHVGLVVFGALAGVGLVLLALSVARSRRAKTKRGEL